MASGPGSSAARLNIRKTGNSTPAKNISFPARRMLLRRGESGETCGSSACRNGTRPPASHSNRPVRASPQREQYRISSETCCWPQLGQYIKFVTWKVILTERSRVR